MAQEWTQVIDQVVEGLYVIKALERAQADRAVFLAETTDGTSRLVDLRVASSPDFETQRQRWSIARDLRHAHLVRIYNSGVISLNGAQYLYCARERHDDCLADVLASRTLNQREAEDVLQAILPCLEYLHGRGLAYGMVRADAVLAFGTVTKLSADSITDDPSATQQPDDMYSVGELILRMFAGDSRNEASLEMVPPPLRDIAQGCLRLETSKRLTASRAIQLLRPHALTGITEKRVSPSTMLTAVLTTVVLAAVVAVTLLRSGGDATKVPQPRTVAQDARRGPVGSTDRPTFGRTRTAPEKPVIKEATKPPSRVAEIEPSAMWAVIAATYKDFDAAERRANVIRSKFEQCACAVFPKKGEGAKYYVVLDSRLTREAADRLHERAIRSGLPADTYVTKLNADEVRSRVP
jgi:hypothetical protein